MKALMENEQARELHTAKKDYEWGKTKKEAFMNFKKEMEKQAIQKKMKVIWVKK